MEEQHVLEMDAELAKAALPKDPMEELLQEEELIKPHIQHHKK
ncbi:hypothetical protein FACS1894122_07610 [Alphaproteobacteria bacterium]|nr:hypothetical protein FACS1894122_07610 [Alphaproteobacteria bacterium]